MGVSMLSRLPAALVRVLPAARQGAPAQRHRLWFRATAPPSLAQSWLTNPQATPRLEPSGAPARGALLRGALADLCPLGRAAAQEPCVVARSTARARAMVAGRGEGRRWAARTTKQQPVKRRPGKEGGAAPATPRVAPTVVIDKAYEFVAPKIWVLRFFTSSSVLCCLMVIGTSNHFYTNMLFLEPTPRLVFIVALGMLAGSMLTMSVRWQRRYVMRVMRDKFYPNMLKISVPHFLGSKSITVAPSEVSPSTFSIREFLFGLPAGKNAAPAPKGEDLRGKRVYSIQVKGYKMVVDASLLNKEDKEKLLHLLGFI